MSAGRYIRSKPNRTGWVHPLLRDTAKAFAATLYDRLAKNNLWWEQNRDEARWIARAWPDLLPAVRTHLGALCGPQSTLPDAEKDKIAQALVQDNELRLGRYRAQVAKVRRVLQ